MARRIARNPLVLVLLGLVAWLALAHVARPVPDAESSCFKRPLGFIRTISPGSTDLGFTVPAGVEFVVTDFTISNQTVPATTMVDLQLFSFGAVQKSARINVPGGETVHVNYASGPRFKEGETVSIFSYVVNTTAHVQVSGYVVTPGCGDL